MEERYKPTKEWAIEVREGCVKLIAERYLRGEIIACPFCIMKEKYTDYKSKIFLLACPWIVFTGFSCQGTGYGDKFGQDGFNFEIQTKEENINRLHGWISNCDKIIEGEKDG